MTGRRGEDFLGLLAGHFAAMRGHVDALKEGGSPVAALDASLREAEELLRLLVVLPKAGPV